MRNLNYKLHGYWRSSSSWRVRIGLEVKGLSYDYLPVHLLRGHPHHEVINAVLAPHLHLVARALLHEAVANASAKASQDLMA